MPECFYGTREEAEAAGLVVSGPYDTAEDCAANCPPGSGSVGSAGSGSGSVSGQLPVIIVPCCPVGIRSRVRASVIFGPYTFALDLLFSPNPNQWTTGTYTLDCGMEIDLSLYCREDLAHLGCRGMEMRLDLAGPHPTEGCCLFDNLFFSCVDPPPDNSTGIFGNRAEAGCSCDDPLYLEFELLVPLMDCALCGLTGNVTVFVTVTDV